MYRVLLAVKPRLLRDALRRELAEEGYVVVGEVDNDLDLLLAVRATQADVVLHSWPERSMPAIATHLLVEYPTLRLLGLSVDGDQAVLCQLRILQTPVPAGSLEDMLDSLKQESPAPAAVSG